LLKAKVPEDPLVSIKDCLSAGRVRWTYHVTMRLQQRGLDAAALGNALASLEIVEAYPDDKYLPSFLLRGEIRGAAFHAQIATNVDGNNVRIVTMYTPDGDEWDEGFRKRRPR